MMMATFMGNNNQVFSAAILSPKIDILIKFATRN